MNNNSDDTRGRAVLVVLTGAYGNIGDGVIRRRVLSWVRDYGTVHAYVGKAPVGWIEQLGLGGDDRIYKSPDRLNWMKMLVNRTAPVALVFDPGEVPLGIESLRSEMIFTALSIIGRMRNTVVIRPPRGIGQFSTIVGWIHRLGAKFSHVVLWRNRRSFELIGHGNLAADTAFQEPQIEGAPWRDRRTLIISMRGKRSFPSDEWIQIVRSIAGTLSLDIQVLSQVREDEVRSGEIARRVGGKFIPWGERSDLDQEVEVRANYERAALVISDRLHVLILAALAGAVPTEIADSPKSKVKEHFTQIGASNIVFDSVADDPSYIVASIIKLCSERDDLIKGIACARRLLDGEQLLISATIEKRLARDQS